MNREISVHVYTYLVTACVVVLELRVAMDAGEDGHVPLGIGEGVSLEGRDELGREKSFKSVL